MNMKRIVFTAAGILIMLIIMGITLHSMSNIDEVNQKRREKNRGEALASKIITTTATTSIWDALRATETETSDSSEEESGEEMQETQPFDDGNSEIITEMMTEETVPVPQTYTETIVIPSV